MHTKFYLENLKGKDHSQDLGTAEDIIRMDLSETEWEGVEWLHLAQDRD
jgi:hypothetical protein